MRAWNIPQVITDTSSPHEATCRVAGFTPQKLFSWGSVATEPDCSTIRYWPTANREEKRILQTAAEMTTETQPPRRQESSGKHENEAVFVLPESFFRQYLELFDLNQGWDGQDEEPPTAEVLSEVFRVAQEVAKYSYRVSHSSLYPELAPGFRGEVGLEYYRPEKELCIEIEPAGDNQPMIRILRVSKDDHGKIVDMGKVESHELHNALAWFVK
ncbi:MAG: hypothetical protein FJ118_10365 [Deltaproteobacteria bacterium]|nr:hypothetical protein [Deltaproteobacteria bacterium]